MILITGVKSGLGKYLHEQLGGFGLSRETSGEKIASLRESGVDVIIHCASRRSRASGMDSVYDYFRDNLGLTEAVVNIPHRKFILISSADVYPKSANIHHEDDPLAPESLSGVYPVSKLIQESIVTRHSPNYLILRATSLIGPYARENSILRILRGAGTVTLSGDSVINCVQHGGILSFLRLAIDQDLTGIYNAASRGNVTLSEVVESLQTSVQFGKYRYDVGLIDNSKIASLCPAFNIATKETILSFKEEFISLKTSISSN